MTDQSDGFILLSPDDNVLVARRRIRQGETIQLDGMGIEMAADLPLGHKLARRPIADGETILKYGAPIGIATRAIEAGEHVHTHNVVSAYTPTYTLDRFKPETAS